ncbi:MAG: dihydroorotase, partial [Burkholderiales bacterium]|nr:dihydroorotase [Burkholderiales bacterium]
VYPLGALTQGLRGERLTEMAELCDAGCVAFSQADVPLRDAAVLLRAMQYAATFGFSVWLRPQNGSLARGGVAHDGELATRLGLAPIPVCAETVALATMLLLARETGAKLHLCRLSSAAGVAMIRAAKSEGLAITCDIAVNHAHLCENDIGFFDSNCHLSPPLRSAEDRDALRAALRDGTIDAICSDHTPVDDDAKQLPFAEAEIGATGLELLLPLTLRWAQESDVALVEALAKITSEPARIIGQADGLSGQPAGQLGVGAAADICIFHPERRWKVEAKSLKSQGKNTPFIGQEMLGKVRYTLVNGDVVREPT